MTIDSWTFAYITVTDHSTGNVTDLVHDEGNLAVPRHLKAQADELHAHTGCEPWYVNDDGMYEALWVQGNTRYSLLYDEMSDLPVVYVLEEKRHAHHVVIGSFKGVWADVYQLAAAIDLR